MELPKISLPSSSEMLDSVKSRLGLGQQQAAGGRRFGRANDEFYDDGYDDYGYEDGYDDYEYEDDYANGYPDYVADDDDRYGTVITRGGSAGVSPARLVSIDDVRANTTMPGRDPLPGRRVGASSSSFRTLVNESTPAPNSPADVSRRRERSESLDDLFEPTTGTVATATNRAGLGSSPLASASVGASYEPYATTTARAASRTLKVIRPLSYGDVEQVAKILRAGDAAVICLEATPSDLAKRILDFSFGVACALDASVDCLSSKVYFIASGAALTEVERMHLRSQGVL